MHLHGVPRPSTIITCTSASAVWWPTQADTVLVKAIKDFIQAILKSFVKKLKIDYRLQEKPIFIIELLLNGPSTL